MPAFDTPDPIAVTIELSVGDVRITASDRTDTVVQVQPTDESQEQDKRIAEQTKVEQTPTGLLIRAPRQRGLGLFGKPGSIDLTIELPSGSGLHAGSAVAAFRAAGRLGTCRIKTSAGDIELEETGPLDVQTGAGAVSVTRITGDTEVSTGTGRIRLGEIEGSAVIKNSNGDTRVEAVTGDLHMSASNGDLAVGRADGSVNAKTASGEIRIGEVSHGTVGAKTAFGEIEIGVRPGAVAELDVYTNFGNVHNHMDQCMPEPTDDIVKVRARTSYGDIVIRHA
jgi:hypothetical protein